MPSTESQGIGFPRLYDLLLLVLTRGRERAYRQATLDLAHLAPGQRLLDIGSGTGTLAIAAWHRLQPGGRVAGTDISPPMLEVARRKARRAGADITFRHGDATAVPFDDAQFDVATITTVLHAIPAAQRRQCLREAHRVLAPGGRLLVVDFGGPLHTRKHRAARHGAHGSFDLAQLRAPLADQGFTSIDAGPLPHLSLHYLRATRP